MLFHTTGLGQTFNFRNYTVDDGLASNMVYRCFQDSKGFLWFGTEAGVSRFDGLNFDLYTVEDGIADNEVFDMHEDSKGRIWFRTFNGKLSYFHDGVIYNETNQPFLKKGDTGHSLISFHEDSKGRIWMGTFEGEIVMIENEEVKIFDVFKGAGMSNFLDIDGIGLRVFFNEYRFDYNEKTQIFIQAEDSYTAAKDIFYCPRKGHAYFLSYNQLIEVSAYGEHPIGDLPADVVTSIAESADGLLYMSSRDHGVFSFSPETQEFKTLFNDITVNYLFFDREHNLWLCTRENGAMMIPGGQLDVRVWNKYSGLEKSTIYDIFIDTQKRIWLGCYDNYVYCIDNDQLQTYVLPHEKDLKSRSVSIIENMNGEIVVAGDGGVYILGNGKKEFETVPVYEKKSQNVFKSSGAKKTCIDKEGKVWVGRSTGVMVLDFSGKGVNGIYDKEIVGGERTIAPFFDREGNFWLSTARGLELFRAEQGLRGTSELLFEGRVLYIDQLDDGTIACATDGFGLLLLYENSVSDTVDINDGLPSNLMNDVFCEGNAAWYACNKGVGRLEVSRGKVQKSMLFGSGNGLISENVRCVYFSDSKLYAGTDQGLCIIPVHETKRVEVKPSVYIRSISGTWGSTQRNEFVNLNYLNNNITVDFASITFAAPEDVQYQYSLDESNTWLECPGHSVSFTQLPYGNHNLKIRAKSGSSEWSSIEQVGFSIEPPFWATKIFFVIVSVLIILLLSLVIGFFYWRRSQQVKQLTLMNQERDRISADLHDDIGADLSKIVVACEVLKHGSDNLNGQMEKIVTTAQNLRSKVDSIIWALNPSNDTVGNFLSYLREFGQDYFDNTPVRFDMKEKNEVCDGKLSSLQRRNLFLMLREIFNNVIKHADAGSVILEVEEHDNGFLFEVRDDGRGVESLEEIKWNNGGRLLRKRAAEINALISWKKPGDVGLSVVIALSATKRN